MSIIIPTDLYYSNMQQSVLSNVLFFAIIMICLAIIIYVTLNKMITDPLSGLASRLEQINHNPSSDVHIENVDALYGSRETDNLFERFNSMSTTLSKLYQDLESQVVERTEQLEEANQQLEMQRKHVEAVNQRLTQDNQYKSDFLAIVSHELRTPLTSILAFTELMTEHVPPEDTRMRRQLDEIGKNSRTLLEMVNNILETARIQAGSERLNLELVDISDVVSFVVTASESLIEQRGLKLTTHIDADTPLIMSDWEKVRQILVNLVSNAIKFTNRGGSVNISVSAKENGRYAVITVQDSGIGIPQDKQDLVFERFTQENMSTARRYGGSGLGLSLVRDLARILGGSVSLESEVDVGSMFTVILPTSGPTSEPGSDKGEYDG